jgi:hypothetical protein
MILKPRHALLQRARLVIVARRRVPHCVVVNLQNAGQVGGRGGTDVHGRATKQKEAPMNSGKWLPNHVAGTLTGVKARWPGIRPNAVKLIKLIMKLRTHTVFASLVAALLTVPVLVSVAGKAKPADPKLRAYTLSICIVTGQKLAADAYTFKYEGRDIKTCCDMCMDDFYKDPANYVAKIEAAEKQKPPPKQPPKKK